MEAELVAILMAGESPLMKAIEAFEKRHKEKQG